MISPVPAKLPDLRQVHAAAWLAVQAWSSGRSCERQMTELMHALTAPGPEPADAIIARVAAKHKLTVREIRTKTRRVVVSHPRQEAMYELRTKLGLSYLMIARLLGLKDHTTVIHGIKAHEARLAATAEKVAA